MEEIVVILRMPEDELIVLAQFVKRIDYDACVRFTSRFDRYHGRDECDVAWSAINMLQRQLADNGFNPR